jgi:hypothetical protein
MWGSGHSFNIAHVFKEFIIAARKKDAELSILPIHGEGNNMCNAMDVPGNHEGIDAINNKRPMLTT